MNRVKFLGFKKKYILRFLSTNWLWFKGTWPRRPWEQIQKIIVEKQP